MEFGRNGFYIALAFVHSVFNNAVYMLKEVGICGDEQGGRRNLGGFAIILLGRGCAFSWGLATFADDGLKFLQALLPAGTDVPRQERKHQDGTNDEQEVAPIGFL